VSPRARVVVTNDHDEVALLERRVLGFRYWEVPGGHVEQGESAAQAAVREIAEELGLELEVAADTLRVVGDVGAHHLYAARVAGRPELRLEGPEVDRGRAGNRYRPAWVPRDEVTELRFLRPGIRAAVVGAINDQRGGRL
jgi:8-oxo-dGTP pyrophosphatase MutT (NUDIX family)